MITNLDLKTGDIGGEIWSVGCAAVEDFLDMLFDKYNRLIKSDNHFVDGGTAVVDWSFLGGQLMIKSIDVEYNGNGKELEYTTSILRHWIFCNAMNFAKILGVVNVKQRDNQNE